jgi:hypothetical protein
MKKLIVLALFALSFLASANAGRIDVPIPTCRPCPLVR